MYFFNNLYNFYKRFNKNKLFIYYSAVTNYSVNDTEENTLFYSYKIIFQEFFLITSRPPNILRTIRLHHYSSMITFINKFVELRYRLFRIVLVNCSRSGRSFTFKIYRKDSPNI